MPNFAYINNKFVNFKSAKIHIEDRGLQFADSVYEVIAVLDKNLIDLDFHLKRLKYSLRELEIKFTINKKNLNNIFLNLIKKNKTRNGIIYLQITRGIQFREHKYQKNLIPTLIVYTRNKSFNLPGKKFVGVNAITYQDLRWKRRDIKTVNLLPNIIAANMAKKKNAYEAILIQNGKVTEGTSSNIWIIKRNNLITHPANSDILKGVTRTSLLKIIKKTKLKLVEKQFTHKQLFNADEVFLTSSGSFITPILKIDNKKINNGKIGNITLKLAEMYTEACLNG
jgi:D-alanine transaminase